MLKLLQLALTALALQLVPFESTPIVSVKAHAGIDTSIVDYVQTQISALPDIYERAFVDLGWVVYVVDWDIASNVFDGLYNSVAGVTLTVPKEIYLEDRISAVEIATVHEFGHFVDYMYGDNNSRHSTAEFMDIYRKEAKGSGFYDTPMEWFAELFSEVYVSPNTTKSVCPEGYAYIKSLEDNL